jgi:hypothetical protein
MKKTNSAVLVYQAGIANVFEVECFNMCDFGRDARRILQADFRTCESFARGLAHAGYAVASAACNEAGDISKSDNWTVDLESAPFFDKFYPVWNGVKP